MQTEALNGLGDVLFAAGDAGTAGEHYATALRLASQAGLPREQARAHTGLARACQVSGDPVQARHHWRQALIRYQAIGAPEAREIRAQLAKARDGRDEDGKPAHRPVPRSAGSGLAGTR
jgi:hypothetical protein